MALTSLGSDFLWPRPAFPTSPQVTVSLINIWSPTPKLTLVCRAPKSGTLDQVEFRMGSATTPMRVSFQGITGSEPNGTQAQYRDFTPAGTGWVTPGLITNNGTDGGTKRVVTRGEWFAIVWEYPGTLGDQYFTCFTDGNATGTFLWARASDAYLMWLSGGVWQYPASGSHGALDAVLKYSDGSYGRFYGYNLPMLSTALEQWGNNSTPDERGLYFSTAAPLRLSGVWVVFRQDAPTDLVLYDTNGTTVLATASMAALGPRATSAEVHIYLRFDTDVDLPVGTGYRLVAKPTTTGQAILQVLTLAAAGHREAYPGGLTCQYTSRTDAGAWTQDGTRLPQLGLIVSGLDAGGSSGGGTDPWLTPLPGSYAAGTAGYLLGHAADAGTLTPAERTAVADVVLGRDFASVAGAANRSLLNAGRFNRNKFVIDRVAGTITVYKEDDTTVAWTGTVTSSAGDPFVGVDPA